MEQPLIIECPLPYGINGRYDPKTEIILINNINRESTLIHETSHYLWHKKDAKLGQFLKKLKLNFNTSERKVLNNQMISQNVDVKGIMKTYERYDWFNEAIAYFMGGLPEKLLRELDFPLFNKILNKDYFYYRPNGDIIYKKQGKVLDNHPNVVKVLDYYRYLKLII